MSAYPNIDCRKYFVALGAFLLLVILISSPKALAENKNFTVKEQGAISVLPYLRAMVDPTGKFNIADVIIPNQQENFLALDNPSLRTSSATWWLRFIISPLSANEEKSNYILDLGQNTPGIPTVFITKHDIKSQKIEWEKSVTSNNSIFMLPQEQTGISIVYIKLQGPPGLWFDPVLRTAYNAATTYDHMIKYALLVTLAIMMIFCLIRGITEKNEWWFWTSLYLGSVLTKSYLGLPATPQGIVETDEIANAVLPGLSLIILVHIARHLMNSESPISISFDKQYLFLIIPGAIIAILPLIPNFTWTARYLELWPLAIILFVPTTLGAWLSGVYGSRRFLLGCLIPPIFTLFAILSIGSGIPSDILATIPLWGVVVGTMSIIAIGSKNQLASSETTTRDTISKDAATVAMQDPSLRLVRSDEINENTQTSNRINHVYTENIYNDNGLANDNADLTWEERLRVPMDALTIETTALSEYSLPPAAKEHVQRIIDLVNILSETMKDPHEEMIVYNPLVLPIYDEGSTFDLQQIMREAHDSVVQLADKKNIGLSWFMPPVLGHKYMGSGQSLLHCLRLLLNNAVRATSHGAVKMSVRRVPESTDPGHLLFSVTDTGIGMPPYRSSASLGRVWELVSTYKGFFGIECNQYGVSISFTLRLQLLAGEQSAETSNYGGSLENNIKYDYNYETKGTAENYVENDNNDNELVLDEFNCPIESKKCPSIIIVDYNLSNRQLLTFFLEGLPFYTKEARTPSECVELHMDKQALLIIFDDDLSEEDTFSSINKIRAFEMQNELPSSLLLALTKDKSRWAELHEGGFTHALEKPITRLVFRNTIQDLLYELVGLFPAQPEQFAQQEFNEHDRASYEDEQFDTSGYGTTYAEEDTEENVGASDEGFSNAHSLDDFLIPNNTAKFTNTSSAYGDETGFVQGMSAYLPDYDFFDEKDSIKIVVEDDSCVKNDYGTEDIDSEQVNYEIMPESEGLVQTKTVQDTLDSSAYENLLDDEIDSTLEKMENLHSNNKDKASLHAIIPQEPPYNDKDEIAHSHIDNMEDMPEVNLEQADNALHDAFKVFSLDESIKQFDSLPIDTESAIHEKPIEINELQYTAPDNDEFEDNLSLPDAEQIEGKAETTQGVISGVDLLQQNSELKDLMTEDEYKFFDAAMIIPTKHEKSSVNHDVDSKIVDDNKENQPINPTSEENDASMGMDDSINNNTPIAENVQTRPSLIPQSSLLSDYVFDEQPSQSKVNDIPTSTLENSTYTYDKSSFGYENQMNKNEELETHSQGVNPDFDMDNSPLSMYNEDKLPRKQDSPRQDDYSINKLEFSSTGKIVNDISAKGNLYINMDHPTTDNHQKPSSRNFALKDDSYSQQDAYASNAKEDEVENNIQNTISANSGKNSLEQENLAQVMQAEPQRDTPIRSDNAFSRLISSDNPVIDSPIPILLDELDASINYAISGFNHSDSLAVQDAAAYIAKRTEACGLRSLSRMALCVEGAAKAKDFDALSNLLPELETAITRNRASLQSQL